MMKKLIRYWCEQEIGELVGEVLTTNDGMLGLARHLGFEIGPGDDSETVRARLSLAGATTERAVSRP